jgi:hypothetical protein
MNQINQYEENDCFGHEYEFLEPLPSSEEDVYQELWVCIHCNQTRVLRHNVVRD